MKIVVDRVTSAPNHSVSKRDIEMVLKHVPAEWIGIKNVFKISSQLFVKSKWDRPVIENGVTYVIMSRGFERDFIIKELLIELVIWPTAVAHSVKGHHISKRDRSKLEEFIQPFYRKIIANLDDDVLL